MALVTVQDCKDYLRIQHTAEDAMLAVWLTMAVARVEAYVRRPITAEVRTFVLEAPSHGATRAITQLHVPIYPVAADPVLTLTGDDAVELVEGTDYRLDLQTGMLTALESFTFAQFPYTVVATVGLSARDDFATRAEMLLNAAILDVVADRYQRRSPAATQETTGGGVSTSFDSANGLPTRVADILAPLRMGRMG